MSQPESANKTVSKYWIQSGDRCRFGIGPVASAGLSYIEELQGVIRRLHGVGSRHVESVPACPFYS